MLQGDTLVPFLFLICLDYVLRISVDTCNEYGLVLELARSRFPTKKITDTDYADDLALLPDNSYNAQKLLHILEQSAAFIGLHVNATKTEYMCYKQDGPIEALNKTPLKKVDDFVYLGSNIASTETNVLIRIFRAWSDLDRLQTIWKSTPPEQIKKGFFRAVVELVLLYGSSAWTLNKNLENKLNGTYTRMLRAILKIHWSIHPSKEHLYGNFVQITLVIKERRTRFAGHYHKSKDEVVSDLILWTPKHGKAKVGGPSKTYTKQLTENADCQAEDLPRAMEGREYWRESQYAGQYI